MASYTILPFDRAAAIEYAHTWAFQRNPAFPDFTDMGGDCSNFISQILLAGGAVMNTTPDYGWYLHSLNDRAAAWTGVPYLFRFLTTNQGIGPFGHEIPINEVQPGDIIQLRFAGRQEYSHSLFVVAAGNPPNPANILIAAHTYDSDYRPLSTYSYVSARGIRIDGIRVPKSKPEEA